MKIVERKCKDLISAEYNPRKLSKDQRDNLKDSLLRFGLVDPIIINKHKDRKDIIVGGHQRLKVWSGDLEHDTIPTVEVDLTLEQERELNVRLNKNTGEFDSELLVEFYDKEELIEWGFGEDDLTFFEGEVLEAEEDDFDVNDNIETDIVIGDLFEIGDHRLLCGDSTDSDQVAKLMDGEEANMVFTDPPYGINYKSNKRKDEFDYIKNDDVVDCSFLPILPIKNNSAIYIWTRWDVYTEWFELVKQSYPVDNCIVWIKKAGGLGDLESYWNQHEFAIYATKGRVKLRGKRQGNTWETEDHRSKDYVHPTQKPIELAARAIEATSDLNNIIVDVFLGSGSTMVAAHQLKRKCYGMELDPKYCQVIVDRMMKLDSDLVVKLNGKPYGKD